MKRRSMLLSGLWLVVRRPGAVVWTYLFSLGIALLFSWRLHEQLGSLLDHSIAAQRLSTAFDLGTLGAATARLGYRTPAVGASIYAGLPLYFLVYFVLVPGALFSYRIKAPGRLAILLSSGLCFFWRFVRITVLTVLVSGLILGPLVALNAAWLNHLDEHVVGAASYYDRLPGLIVILLVAASLRLYFDLVEVYTVQLDDLYKPNGKPDRRVRKTLIPAAKTLWRNLPRALGSFLLIALIALAVAAFTGAVALRTLAQPRVWPAFLLVQIGMFVSLLTRFWQRGAETVLAAEFLLPGAVLLDGETEGLQPSCSSYVYDKVREFPVVVPVVVPVVAPVVAQHPTPEPPGGYSL